jgi:hypothetical protein
MEGYAGMKNLIYSKKDLVQRCGRAVSVREVAADRECDTQTRKSFVYLVHRVDAVPQQVPAPNVRVIKAVDTRELKEFFFLRIKGTVYFKQGRFIHRVDYLHSLQVRMLWKDPVLSTDSATLS